MQVLYSNNGGRTEAQLSSDSDWRLFEQIASVIATRFSGRWVEKLDGPDQRYWDIVINGQRLTLHLEHYLGISLFPAEENENDSGANQLVRKIGAFLEATGT